MSNEDGSSVLEPSVASLAVREDGDDSNNENEIEPLADSNREPMLHIRAGFVGPTSTFSTIPLNGNEGDSSELARFMPASPSFSSNASLISHHLSPFAFPITVWLILGTELCER